MRAAVLSIVFLGTAILLANCSREETPQNLFSEVSEYAWLTDCASTSSIDNRNCANRQIMWVLSMSEEPEPGHNILIAQLGPPNNGIRVEVELKDPLAGYDQSLRTRTFFVSGNASADLTPGRRPMVRISDAEVIGFQTLSDGPKQGPLAAEMTLGEFGRYCLLAPQETYTEQCAGKRVVWYGFLRGAANDGVIMGLPFDDASIARIKTAEELPWPIGETLQLRDQPVVIEGILGEVIGRREDGERVPNIEQAHIINFPRHAEPLIEITGVR